MSEPFESTGEGFTSPTPSGSVSESRFDAGADEHSAGEKASEVIEQGKEKAKELGAKAQERVMSKAEELRSGTAQKLHKFADAMEDMSHGDSGEDLAPIARYGARFVHRAAEMVEKRDTDELLAQVRQEVRQRPGLVLLGMAALGFFGARLLKE